ELLRGRGWRRERRQGAFLAPGCGSVRQAASVRAGRTGRRGWTRWQVQILNAHGDQEQGHRCTADPTRRRPSPCLATLLRDGEPTGRRLHRQGTDGMGRFAQALEASTAFVTAGNVVGDTSLCRRVELVVEICRELFQRRLG